MRLLWASDGCFEVGLPHFQKTVMFPMYFNDFMILCSQLGVTLESLGVVLGNFWVTLGLLWVYDGGFGSLLGHFGVTLGT